MAFEFDIKTLLLALILGNTFTAMLIWAYRSRSPKDQASSLFIASKLLQALCWILVFVRDALPGRWAVPASNALILSGGGLEILTLLSLMKVSATRVRNYYSAVALIGVAGYAFLFLTSDAERIRIAFTSLIAFFFVAFPACCLIANFRTSLLQLLMGLMYGAVCVILLMRAAYAATAEGEMSVFTAGMAQNLYYLGMFTVMMLGTAGYVLLVREHSYEELKRFAAYDELTGVLNRRAFIAQAERKIGEALDTGMPVTFLLLDIDLFKSINDTYGHVTGDEVLRTFSSVIERHLEQGDVFGRYGGEEFAVLLSGTDEEGAMRRAEEMRIAVMGIRMPGIALTFTVSIGGYTMPAGKETMLDTMYSLSDMALYRAKQSGRNKVVYAFEE